jgi:hypothetical protein
MRRLAERQDDAMNMTSKLLMWIAAACAVSATLARAQEPVLTFEGLQNFEAVGDYYNGGYGSLGSGPGPNYGITFTSNALAYIPGQQSGKVTPFPGDPSPPTVLLLANNLYSGGYPLSLTMDVAAGFSQALIFYDIAIVKPASVQIWSGFDGQGTMLAQQNLPLVPATNQVFTGALTVPFSGEAYSVIFSGGNDELALDNITFAASVPEPSSWIPLVTGLGCSCLVLAWRRRKAVSRPRPV